MAIVIQEATQVTEKVVQAFARLIPQLSDAIPPDRKALEEIVASPATMILLAIDPDQENQIVGALTLAMFRTPTALHAWIEDVVVDVNYRNRGIGERLVRAAIQRAASAGARHVDLTSRPQRQAANRLYRKLGFQLRSTNLYRLTLD